MQTATRYSGRSSQRKVWLFFLSGALAVLISGCMSEPAYQPEDKPIV